MKKIEASLRDDTSWSQLLKNLRQREGLSQDALAQILGVNQTTVSKWERQQDVPSMRMRRRIQEFIRRSSSGLQDRLLRIRVRQGFFPQTLLQTGAVFIEANSAVTQTAQLPYMDLRGQSIYGKFGDAADAITQAWEDLGIFKGEISLSMAVVPMINGDGDVTYIQTQDFPYFSSDGEIWSVSELRVIAAKQYDRFIKEYGSSVVSVSFDAI